MTICTQEGKGSKVTTLPDGENLADFDQAYLAAIDYFVTNTPEEQIDSILRMTNNPAIMTLKSAIMQVWKKRDRNVEAFDRAMGAGVDL